MILWNIRKTRLYKKSTSLSHHYTILLRFVNKKFKKNNDNSTKKPEKMQFSGKRICVNRFLLYFIQKMAEIIFAA